MPFRHCFLTPPPLKDIPWPVRLDSESVRRKHYDVEQSSRILCLSPSGQNFSSPTATPKGPFSPLKLPCEERCDQSDLARWPHCGSARTGTHAADLQNHGSLLPQPLQRAHVSDIWWCTVVGPDSSFTKSWQWPPFPFCVTTFVWSPNTHDRKPKTIRKLLFKKNRCANEDKTV